jgi:hypothetical protein
VFIVVELALLAAIPVLAWIGFRTVLDTTAGEAVDPELDPAEPGYEAFLEPTPVSLMLGVDDAGALSWVAAVGLSGSDEQGGALLMIPPGTVTAAGRLGEVPLAAAWDEGGQELVASAVADLLGAGFDDVIVLDPARLAELVAPAGPLTIRLSDDVGRFEAGEVQLDGPAVAELLQARGEEENDLNRMGRHEQVWRAWLAAIAASDDPDVVPGEAASGPGRYLRGLAAGPSSVELIPVTNDGDRFEPDIEATRDLVAERVPFPIAARPGARPRVRVLDGVGVEGLALQAARDAVRAGGQVTVIGNADRFDADESRIVYFDPAVAAAAEDVAEAFGIDDVQRSQGPNPNDLVDLTVVVGQDLAAAYGLASG